MLPASYFVMYLCYSMGRDELLVELSVLTQDHFSKTRLVCADISWQVGLLTFSALSTVLLTDLK
jgi:hypothetical protein